MTATCDHKCFNLIDSHGSSQRAVLYCRFKNAGAGSAGAAVTQGDAQITDVSVQFKRGRQLAAVRQLSHLGGIVQAVVRQELLDLSQHAAKGGTEGVHGRHSALVPRRHAHLAKKVLPAVRSGGGRVLSEGSGRGQIGTAGSSERARQPCFGITRPLSTGSEQEREPPQTQQSWQAGPS